MCFNFQYILYVYSLLLIQLTFFVSDETIDPKTYPIGDVTAKLSQNGYSDDEMSSKCFRADMSHLKISPKMTSLLQDKILTTDISKSPIKLGKTDITKSKLTLCNKISENVTSIEEIRESKRIYHNGISHNEESEDECSAEKGELEANGKAGEKKHEQDVVFIQDVGFTIKIQSPGIETFDIQVNYKCQIYKAWLILGNKIILFLLLVSFFFLFLCRCQAWSWCRRYISC